VAEEDDPRAGLRRIGIADVHGLIALFAGGIGLLSGLACCLVRYRSDEAIVVHIGILVVAIWAGAFGVVTRGSEIGRLLAKLGLGMALFALFLGMLALCRLNVY
jgi:hypothetical protein